MEAVENRMVVDWQWPEMPTEITEKLNRTGYEEMKSGIFVPEEDAFDYAMDRLSWDADLQKEFVEWFYSDNWVREDGREAHV